MTLRVSSRARQMRLKVDTRTGAVLLTIPPRASRRKAIAWAEGHREWIETTLAQIEPSRGLAPGSILPFEGTAHTIEWNESWLRTPKIDDGLIKIGGPPETVESRLQRWLKQHAKSVLERETREFASKAGVTVTRVGVGDPLSRWGSCSTSGGIRYSWRLILAPDWVRRATVAHEVAHRVHMNHAPPFHALVEELLGWDPAPARQWLRREGAGLHRIGPGRI